jgi:hypothetical protein
MNRSSARSSPWSPEQRCHPLLQEMAHHLHGFLETNTWPGYRSETMKPLIQLVKAIARATEAVIELVCALVRLPARAFRWMRGRSVRDKLEAERLDRIRNPEKYLGK